MWFCSVAASELRAIVATAALSHTPRQLIGNSPEMSRAKIQEALSHAESRATYDVVDPAADAFTAS